MALITPLTLELYIHVPYSGYFLTGKFFLFFIFFPKFAL